MWIETLTKHRARKLLPYMQVAMYVMAGGGFVGVQWAEQPASAYVDSRCSKRPFSIRRLDAARKDLVAVAIRAGYDPDNLPKTPDFTNMGGAF